MNNMKIFFGIVLIKNNKDVYDQDGLISGKRKAVIYSGDDICFCYVNDKFNSYQMPLRNFEIIKYLASIDDFSEEIDNETLNNNTSINLRNILGQDLQEISIKFK